MSPVAERVADSRVILCGCDCHGRAAAMSGFVGKLMILDASFETPFGVWVWMIVLTASLISLIGFARAEQCLLESRKRSCGGRRQRGI
jgi:multicomponent K+:H+ antiporter subunit D